MRTLAGVLSAAAMVTYVCAVCASPAPEGAAFVVPTQAGVASHLHVDAKGQSGGLTPKEIPTALGIAFQRGFTIDPAAVAGTCSADQAQNFACPADSVITNGSFVGVVEGAGFGPSGMPFNASLTFYKAPPQQAGDPAGVVFTYKEQSSGFHGESLGRLMELPNDSTYGEQIRFDKLPLPDLPPGITVTLNELKLDIGAGDSAPAHSPMVTRKRRRHRLPYCSRHRRHHCRHRHHKRAARSAATGSFITNPATCAGNWTVQLQVDYPGHQERREANVPCTAG